MAERGAQLSDTRPGRGTSPPLPRRASRAPLFSRRLHSLRAAFLRGRRFAEVAGDPLGASSLCRGEGARARLGAGFRPSRGRLCAIGVLEDEVGFGAAGIGGGLICVEK